MIVDLYRRAWVHSDETIGALSLEDIGRVPWWPSDRSEVTLHRVLVHVTTETHRHAGHADIVLELIDGKAGLRPSVTNLPDRDDAWWTAYRSTLRAAADPFLKDD